MQNLFFSTPKYLHVPLHSRFTRSTANISTDVLRGDVELLGFHDLIAALICQVYLDVVTKRVAATARAWHPVCRSIIMFFYDNTTAKLDQIKTSLMLSNELSGAAKHLHMNALDLSEMVSSAQEALRQSSTKRNPIVTREQVAKEFEQMQFSDSKHSLKSSRVVGSLLNICEAYVRDPQVHSRCQEMILKFGVECMFDTFYRLETLLVSLGRQHRHHLLEVLGYVNHFLERGYIANGKLTIGLLQMKTGGNSPDMGLIGLLLARIGIKDYLYSRYPGASTDLKAIYGSISSFDMHFLSNDLFHKFQEKAAAGGGTFVPPDIAWTGSLTGGDAVLRKVLHELYACTCDRDLKEAWKEVK